MLLYVNSLTEVDLIEICDATYKASLVELILSWNNNAQS